MDEIEIAFIGGSGLYKVNELKNISWISRKSDYGKPSSKICVGKKNEKNMLFFLDMEKNTLYHRQKSITEQI